VILLGPNGETKPLKKRFGRAERVLWAIVFARKRYKDDSEFVEKVNEILDSEGIVERKEFGVYQKRDEENE
jgi:ribosomal protein S16